MQCNPDRSSFQTRPSAWISLSPLSPEKYNLRYRFLLREPIPVGLCQEKNIPQQKGRSVFQDYDQGCEKVYSGGFLGEYVVYEAEKAREAYLENIYWSLTQLCQF